MDLKEFVSSTLLQICEGVQEAQARADSMGGIVNPATISGTHTASGYFGEIDSGRTVFLIDFDVAVSVVEGAEAKAGGKLQVASLFSIGAGGSNNSSQASTSRITFKVPMALPVDPSTHARLKSEIARFSASVAREDDY